MSFKKIFKIKFLVVWVCLLNLLNGLIKKEGVQIVTRVIPSEAGGATKKNNPTQTPNMIETGANQLASLQCSFGLQAAEPSISL